MVIIAAAMNGTQQEKVEEGADVTISRLILSSQAAWAGLGWHGLNAREGECNIVLNPFKGTKL